MHILKGFDALYSSQQYRKQLPPKSGKIGAALVVSPEAASRKILDSKSQYPKASKEQMSKPEKQEVFDCTFRGCKRRFINKAELKNHIGVFHASQNDNQQSQDVTAGVGAQWAVPQETDGLDDPDDPEDATITQIVRIEGEKTIKAVPLPVTAASLKALDSSIDTGDLMRSVDELSISQIRESSPSEMSLGTTYSVYDVDEEQESEIAEEDSPRILIPVQILLNRWKAFNADFQARVKQNATFPGDRSPQSTASASRESLVSSSAASSQVSGVKRGRSPNERDDEQDRKNNKRVAKLPQSLPEHLRPLACPFNKFDSNVFGVNGSNSAYHVCSTWSDVKTAYFKQHLLRTHCMPEHHCDRCGVDCKNSGELRKHRRLDPPCTVKELDSQKIMPEIQDQIGLRTRNTVKTDRISYWNSVFDLIFSQKIREEKNIDPYYNGPLAEGLNSLLRFSEVRMPQAIRSSRQRLGLDPDDYSETDSQLNQMILQEVSQAYMAEMRNPQPPNLREMQQRNFSTTSVEDPTSEAANESSQPRRTERHISMQDSSPQPWTPAPSSHQPLEASAQYTQQSPAYSMNLPTRPAQQLEPMPHSPFDFQPQMTGYTYSELTAQDFDAAPYLVDYTSVIETPDMYGPGTMPESDFEGFHVVHPNPSQRQRQGP